MPSGQVEFHAQGAACCVNADATQSRCAKRSAPVLFPQTPKPLAARARTPDGLVARSEESVDIVVVDEARHQMRVRVDLARLRNRKPSTPALRIQ